VSFSQIFVKKADSLLDFNRKDLQVHKLY